MLFYKRLILNGSRQKSENPTRLDVKTITVMPSYLVGAVVLCIAASAFGITTAFFSYRWIAKSGLGDLDSSVLYFIIGAIISSLIVIPSFSATSKLM